MATNHPNVLTAAELDALLALPEVIAARAQLDTQSTGSVFLTVHLTDAMKTALQDRMGLDLSAVDTVPMRWIKGDTHPHVDRTQSRDAFTNTYLMYVNDSPGEFIVGDESYPIASGTAYVFAEGTSHETRNTGTVPRLLLGPMSEVGLAVGAPTTTISANGATDTVYIRQLTSGGNVEYQINSGGWNTITFPCTVSNTNGTPASNILKVLFTTDITISNINTYFVCDSAGLQFGDSALPASGVRPTITLEAGDYLGLIQNGTNSVDGKNNIYVYNLIVDQRGFLPATNAGHIGQTYFGRAATNNYFVNCTSLGTIPSGGGGIVGANAAANSGSMTLIGCSNVISASSPLLADSGGIVGSYAGNVTCVQCWSEGEFADTGAGGIFGSNANGATATKCYSNGPIYSSSCGGIFGSSAQNCTGAYCYSIGAISGAGAGGIYGASSSDSSLTNSFSTGTITNGTDGLLGSSSINITPTSCYVANGAWNTTNALAALGSGPTSDPGWSTNWISTGANTAYELASFGYTPYTRQNITATYPPSLVQTYSATVQAGGSTTPAVKTATFSLIPGPTAYPTITINSTTGAITASAATTPGAYTLYVRNTGSYNNTTFILTVTAAPSSGSTGCCPTASQLQDLDNTTLTQVKRGVIIGLGPRNPSSFSSYSDYITYKLTKSFLRN